MVFTTSPRLEDGEVHRGKVKLSGTPDPFESDDERFFVFKVRPPLKVLLLSDVPYEAEFVAAALDPESPGSRPAVPGRNGPDVPISARYKNDLQSYACVFLLNVKKLDEAEWGALNHYVHEGGGLVVAPGQRSLPESYNNSIASQLLPAQLERATQDGRAAGHVRQGRQHHASVVPAVRQGPGQHARAWCPFTATGRSSNRVEGTHTLLSFSDGAPALLERTFKGPKTGRVLLWTTPLSRRPDVGGALRDEPECLERVPVAIGWPFLVLMHQTVPYLAGRVQRAAQFRGGRECALEVGADRPLHEVSW